MFATTLNNDLNRKLRTNNWELNISWSIYKPKIEVRNENRFERFLLENTGLSTQAIGSYRYVSLQSLHTVMGSSGKDTYTNIYAHTVFSSSRSIGGELSCRFLACNSTFLRMNCGLELRNIGRCTQKLIMKYRWFTSISSRYTN